MSKRMPSQHFQVRLLRLLSPTAVALLSSCSTAPHLSWAQQPALDAALDVAREDSEQDAAVTNDAAMSGDGSVPNDAAADAGSCPPPMVLPPRGETFTVLDAAHNRLITLAGNAAVPMRCAFGATEVVFDAWAFDLACESWQPIAFAGAAPRPRIRSSYVHDRANNRILMFGGRFRNGSSGPYTEYNDVWALDLSDLTWEKLSPDQGLAPAPTSAAAMMLAPDGSRFVIATGSRGATDLTNETWSFDLTTRAWTKLTPGPAARLLAHSIVVGNMGYLIAGGTFRDFDNDVWSFSFESNTWARVSITGALPLPRFGHGLFWHEGRALMFGGHDSSDLGHNNELWALSIADRSWSKINRGDIPGSAQVGMCMLLPDFAHIDESSPERREQFGYAQSETTGYIVGGKTDCGNSNDVWALDLATGTWRLLGIHATAGDSCERSGNANCSSYCF